MVVLKVQDFFGCDAVHTENVYPRLEGSMCFYLQGQAAHEDSPWTDDAEKKDPSKHG